MEGETVEVTVPPGTCIHLEGTSAEGSLASRVIIAPPQKDSTLTVPLGSTVIPPFSNRRSAVKVQPRSPLSRAPRHPPPFS